MIAQEVSRPVPTWAKVIAVLLALGTLGLSAPLVAAGAFWLVSVRVTRHLSLSAPLAAGQRLVVSAEQATLELKIGPAGLVRVEITDWTRVTTHSGLEPLRHVTAAMSSMADGQRLDVGSVQSSDANLGGETVVTVEVPVDTPIDVTAGSVTASGLTGGFQISAGAGTVSLTDMVVAKSSSVHAAGSVEFSGLVTSGTLDLTSGFGGIDARFNRLSDARIEADTTIGDITTGPGLALAISTASISKHASGSMGAGSGLITLRTGLGNIKIGIN